RYAPAARPPQCAKVLVSLFHSYIVGGTSRVLAVSYHSAQLMSKIGMVLLRLKGRTGAVGQSSVCPTANDTVVQPCVVQPLRYHLHPTRVSHTVAFRPGGIKPFPGDAGIYRAEDSPVGRGVKHARLLFVSSQRIHQRSSWRGQPFADQLPRLAIGPTIDERFGCWWPVRLLRAACH